MIKYFVFLAEQSQWRLVRESLTRDGILATQVTYIWNPEMLVYHFERGNWHNHIIVHDDTHLYDAFVSIIKNNHLRHFQDRFYWGVTEERSGDTRMHTDVREYIDNLNTAITRGYFLD